MSKKKKNKKCSKSKILYRIAGIVNMITLLL